jgi:hypothetical protein
MQKKLNAKRAQAKERSAELHTRQSESIDASARENAVVEQCNDA